MWVKAGLTIPRSPLEFKLSNEDTIIEPRAGSNYLILGRVAATTKESASKYPDDWEFNHLVGHVRQFRAKKLPCGRVIHTNHTVFLQQSIKIWRGNLSENGSFQDIVGIEQGCAVEFVAEGETAAFCKPWG